MPQAPTIAQILAVPGLDASISVGLELNGERVAWGECILPSGNSLTQDAVLATLKQTVIPALQGQPLTDFRALTEKVETLTEEVTVSQPAPPPPPDTRVQNPSRRNLFSGKLWLPPETPPTEDVIVERIIHPAIRYGVSQALLAAVSIARNVTMAEVLAKEYKLRLSKTTIPIHVELNETNAIHIASLLPAASLGYTTPGDDIEAELGANGEILQRAIRNLQKRLTVAAGDNFPTIHVNARGGLGKLYDNVGKILGAIFGLTKASSPCSMRIEDPVHREDRQTHIEAMFEVKDYLRMRRMATPLVAGAWINSPDDVLAFAEAGAAGMIRLNMPRLGSLHRSIEAALICKKRDIAILLDAGPAESAYAAQVACHTALTLQPALLSGASLPLLHNEMARTLAWVSQTVPAK